MKLFIRKLASCGALCFAVAGCTSLVGKGDELFEAGNYHEAAELYEAALERDESNVEASIGLKRARTKIIDQDLIETRMLRLGSNMPAAAEKLEKVLANQRIWNIESQGAVAATQSQEVRFAKPWVLEEATRLASSAKPDQLVWFDYAFQELIAATRSKASLNDNLSLVQAKGQARCQELSTRVSGQRYFLSNLARQYCSGWKITKTLTTDKVDKSRFQGLIFDEDISYRASSNADLRNVVEQELTNLRDQFRSNIWHSPSSSRPLSVDVFGDVRYTRSRNKERRQKNYVVSKTVKTEDSRGVEVSNVTEQTKTHYYIAQVFNESFRVGLQVRADVVGVPITRLANITRNNRTDSHREDFAAADLNPKQPDFLNIEQLLDSEVSQMMTEFLIGLTEAWRKHYCEDNIGAEEGENIMRCAAVDEENTLVDNWFKKEFGLGYRQMAELYSL